MDDLLEEMIQPAGSTAHDRARRRRLIASAATLSLAAVGVTSLTTSALFSDNDAATGGGFTTGTVNVELAPLPFQVAVDNMAPGDTQYRSLTVDNPGSLEYRYAVTKSWVDVPNVAYPLNLLSGVLQLATVALPEGSDCTAVTAPTGADIRGLDFVEADGPVLFGNPATGADTGDRILPAGSAEVLCFQITLPDTVGNEYQLSKTTVSVQVFAEQTVNN